MFSAVVLISCVSCPTGIYEKRIEEYRREMAEVSSTFKGNVKAVGKKILGFLRESGRSHPLLSHMLIMLINIKKKL